MIMTTLESTQHPQQLQLLLQKIEGHLGWGSGLTWRHQDFQTLSGKILEKTGEQLSTTTLKRIWGKLTYHSLPNTHTLNTLAQFVDYENWVTFQSLNNENIVPLPKEKPQRFRKKNHLFTTPILKLFGLVALLLLLSLAVISLISESSPPALSAEVLESIKFSSHPVTTGVPNTVIFKYDVSKVPSDNIQIQQNWEERRRFDIQKSQSEVASTYYYPGHWLAKLVIDNQIIQEQDIYIKSNGWVTTINKEPIPRYLKGKELIGEGFLGISDVVQQEIENGMTAPEMLTHHFVEEFPNLESSNFTLALSFKNTYTKGDGICQYSRLAIDCTQGVFLIPFSIPGCVGDLSMRFSEIVQRGKNHNFSAFGCDYNQWQRFKLEVKNKQARVFLNNQLIHEVVYQENAGKVAGVKIRFVGSGAIDDVKLINGEGIMVYKEGFDDELDYQEN